MAATFISLTNQVLRRLNEVEIAPADFENVRGVQALAKDSVRSAIATINQREFEWPFNAAEQTDALVVGVGEYAWPEQFKVADWNSFIVLGDSGLGVSFHDLKFITRDEWYARHRADDLAAGSNGRGIPRYVFKSHGVGYGITPSPDKAYSIKFRYFRSQENLQVSEDTTRIPESWQNVIVDGALVHMYMFKDNIESAAAAVQAFNEGLKAMEAVYINAAAYVYDTRVNFGGDPYRKRGRYAR